MSDILDQLIIDTEDELKATKAGHTRKAVTGKRHIKVRSSVEKARDDYKIAKATHRANIKAIKKEMRLRRKIARNNIKAHRNMIATAKTTFKSIKLADK